MEDAKINRRPPPFIGELAPWRALDLGASPWDGMWAFNPSILRRLDGTWLCSVRCANYRMPGGIAELDPSGTIKNRNLLLEIDPRAFDNAIEAASVGYADARSVAAGQRAGIVTRALEMTELDDRPRRYTKCLGYEDLRLVETSTGRLHAVSTAMQLSAAGKQEIVLLDLDAKTGAVTSSQPLRGAWSDNHQKNWTPYQHADELLLVYSIERGGVFDRTGQIWPWNPATIAPLTAPDLPDHLQAEWLGAAPTQKRPTVHKVGGIETRVMGSAPRMSRPGAGTYRDDRFPLRGGSQLVRIDTDLKNTAEGQSGVWLGIAHGMRMIGTYKFYWHVAYLMNDRGVLLARSDPFKISERGIEFCAGLALDPSADRAVLSFGVDDERAMLGVTTISGLLATLRPVEYAARKGDGGKRSTITPNPASPATVTMRKAP